MIVETSISRFQLDFSTPQLEKVVFAIPYVYLTLASA
jgi:hypothetical protein